MKKSHWMRGLLYAERVGAKEAQEQLSRYEFEDDLHDFDIGVMDYINHHRQFLSQTGKGSE